jgi:hypothetical protein
MEEQRYYLFKLGVKKFRFIGDPKEGIIYLGPVPKQPRYYRTELEEITDPLEIEDIFKGH